MMSSGPLRGPNCLGKPSGNQVNGADDFASKLANI
jgi:hypothetical protein